MGEILIAVALGVWLIVAGILAYRKLNKDLKEYKEDK